jgi:CubicO group peptidase (beta-lactamase class C family)
MSLVCAGCGGPGTSAPRTYSMADMEIPITGPTVPESSGLDRNVVAMMKKWNVPAVTVAVVKNGKLVFAKGYGYANLESKTPVQPNALFRIASVSKMLTAVSTLQLVEQGKLSLDARALDVLTDYVPPAGADARLGTITIRMLLQHSGGWDVSVSGDPSSKQVEIASALGVPAPAKCAEIFRYMLGKPLDFDPGTKFAYSNLSFCVLGRVIERVSGETYQDYVKNHVLEPAGVHAMYIGTTQQGGQGPGEVTYYDVSGAPLVNSVFPGEGQVPMPYGGFEVLDSASGWVASSVDLLRFMSALDGSRTSPALLGAPMLQQMTANPGLPGLDPSMWYGFGTFVGPSPNRWWHSGTGAGIQAQLCHDSTGYSYAMLANTNTIDPTAFAPALEDAVKSALDTDFVGSEADLFSQFPSEAQ